MFEFKLPDLGEGIHEGEILQWHVAEGGFVEQDADLVEVETDKAAVTIPSPVAGRVVRLGAEVGDIVTVGTVIVVIDEGSSSEATATGADAVAAAVPTTTSSSPTPPSSPTVAAAASSTIGSGAATAQAPRRPVPAAPATRRLARELGVDLRAVQPTGPAGRVTADDVRTQAARGDDGTVAAADPAPTPSPPALQVTASPSGAEADAAARSAGAIPFLDLEPLPDFSQWGPVERVPLRSIRRKVAHRMVTSKVLVPHVAHLDEADVTDLERIRLRQKQQRSGQPGGRLTLLAFVVKAVTARLVASPAFNASLEPFGEQIIYKKYYNIGIAADTGRGLVVPVIHGADRQSIVQIAAEIERLGNAAREGELEVAELRGGTFTITNIGAIGGTAVIPAINYPEVAILGMGRVQEKPVVRDGEIAIRKILPLSFAFDHRIADGADAARFVTEIVRQLSDPDLLLLET